MSFEPITDLSIDRSDSKGIIRLWIAPDYIGDGVTEDTGGWSTTGTFGEDLYKYFFLPNGFIYQNGMILYNFPFRYAEIQIYLIKFYGLYYVPKRPCNIKTDLKTRLPFVIKPDCGEPDYYPEKCYFTPCGGEV